MDVDEAARIVENPHLAVSVQQLALAGRVLAAEVTELRAMRARAQHLAEHHPDPSAAGAALQILGRTEEGR